MALGKFLAWKVWTELEKSEKRKAASKQSPGSLTLSLPSHLLPEVKAQWPVVRSKFFERVGFAVAEPTLEPSDGEWSLGIRGGLLEQRWFEEEWLEPLVQLLVAHSSRFLSLALVKGLVDEVKASHPVIGEELERLRLPVTVIYRVLEGLLEEAVPIHQMETILTAVVLNWEHGPDRQQLLSCVRRALSPWICQSVQVRPGVLRAFKMGRRIEEMFADCVRFIGSEQVFVMEPQQRALVAVLVKQAVMQLGGTERHVLLTNHRIRHELQMILKAELPDMVVLSDSEIHSGFKVEIVAIVDFKEPLPAAASSSEESNNVEEIPF